MAYLEWYDKTLGSTKKWLAYRKHSITSSFLPPWRHWMVCLHVILYPNLVEKNVSERLKSSQLMECRGMQARNGKINAEMQANTECVRNPWNSLEESGRTSWRRKKLTCILNHKEGEGDDGAVRTRIQGGVSQVQKHGGNWAYGIFEHL